jgi:hypothetical protein
VTTTDGVVAAKVAGAAGAISEAATAVAISVLRIIVFLSLQVVEQNYHKFFGKYMGKV